MSLPPQNIPKKEPKAYAQAGVDITLGNKVKGTLAKKLSVTHTPEVLGKVGGFGGLFNASFKDYKEPILVSSIDGVGTKLKVAIAANKHDTVGVDLVHHCINDIAVLGARPLFFLDYIGLGKLEPKVFSDIIKGLTHACQKSGCALIGGETAQMAGIYQPQDYDLVGTIVGVVEKKLIIDGSRIRPGDCIIGFASNGLHTNGYSLARKILFETLGLTLTSALPYSKTTKPNVAQELLKTHLNYEPLLRKLSEEDKIDFKGLAHITGGGIIDNIPRVLPADVAAEIQLKSWPVPSIFKLLMDAGKLSTEEAYQVFNMGIGMTAIVSPQHAERILKKTRAYLIGKIIRGEKNVILK